MSKKTIITISVVLLLLFLSLIAYYFLISGGNNGTGGGINSGFRGLFQFGQNNNPPAETATSTEQKPPEEKPADNFTQKLRKLSSEPVAGAGTLDVKAGTIVRYIEIATGHIYEIEMFSPRKARISNTTIPIAYNAVWGNKNNSLVTQYLADDNETIDTYSLSLKNISTSTENSITGITLPKRIASISSYGTEIFYLLEATNQSAGYVSDFENKKARRIWDSNINQITSQFINSKTVGLTTKPAKNVPGYMYIINTQNGDTKSVLGGVYGLTTLSDPTALNILYLENSSLLKMSVYNTKTGSKLKLEPSTFPEKCVWSRKNTNIIYCAVPRTPITPDSLTYWYQGRISPDDDIWKYDVKDGSISIVGLLSPESGETIDAIKPQLSENEQYLVFVNKKDNSLWSLDLLQ